MDAEDVAFFLVTVKEPSPLQTLLSLFADNVFLFFLFLFSGITSICSELYRLLSSQFLFGVMRWSCLFTCRWIRSAYGVGVGVIYLRTGPRLSAQNTQISRSAKHFSISHRDVCGLDFEPKASPFVISTRVYPLVSSWSSF